MIRNVLLFLIRSYQILLSPLKVTSCRFIPTCSQYAYDAVRLYGPLIGSLMALKRLARCHPFHPGGYDPIVAPPCASHFNRWSNSEWKKER